MQTKCGNLIPLLEIPLYIDSEHLNVLLFSLNEKKKKHQTKKKKTTWCSLGPRQETYLLKQKARKKKKLQVLHIFIHLNCLQFGKFFFVRFQFFTNRVNHVTHNILGF